MGGKMDLFKAALGNEVFLTENSNLKNQLQFIMTLEENQFTPQEIIELINMVKNHKIRSLLIIHLLSQKEYLRNLKGESLLDRIGYNSVSATPSRLNAWIHQLDVTQMTPELIKKLDPEAAISLLCSIPHFHLLRKEQVDALLHKYLEKTLIVYWIKHFASMPNAHYILAHLMKLVSTNVIDALMALEPNKQKVILTRIVEHLNLFDPIPKRLQALIGQEDHLQFAMKLYLGGHYYHAYTTLIAQVTNSLLKKNALSFPILELLFSLNDVSELGDILTSTGDLTNIYLRVNANQGRAIPFSRDGHLNIQKMIQKAPIRIPKPLDTELQKQEKPLGAEERSLVKSIIQHNKSLNYFEYFLIYYQGDSKLLQQLLHEYLRYYEEQPKSTQRDQAVHHLGFLLSRNELSSEIRKEIFAALLRYPVLHDEYMSLRLYFYDAPKTLQYYGFQGSEENYNIILNICSHVLNKLKPDTNQELINIAQQAQREAEIELQFSKETGFFARIINFIKRCWIYGWSGFFSPNLPVYVIPTSYIADKKSADQSEGAQELIIKPEKELPELLTEMERKSNFTKEKFAALIEALNRYSLKDMQKNEIETRLKLHNLFYKVLQKKERYTILYPWLMGNQGPFLDNQFRLLELSFEERSAGETQELIKQISTGPDKIKNIMDELNCALPEPKEPHLTPVPPETSHVLTNASETFSGYLVNATQHAHSAWSWASTGLYGLKNGFFTKKEDKEKEGQSVNKSISCV